MVHSLFQRKGSPFKEVVVVPLSIFALGGGLRRSVDADTELKSNADTAAKLRRRRVIVSIIHYPIPSSPITAKSFFELVAILQCRFHIYNRPTTVLRRLAGNRSPNGYAVCGIASRSTAEQRRGVELESGRGRPAGGSGRKQPRAGPERSIYAIRGRSRRMDDHVRSVDSKQRNAVQSRPCSQISLHFDRIVPYSTTSSLRFVRTSGGMGE